jgi:hypothetical protein
MATPKGYSNKEKLDRLSAEFTTISPSGPFKYALDVRDVGSVSVFATDLVEANSTVSVVNATAHVALVGDRLRFTSGPNQGLEVDVWSKTTNTITLGQDLPTAPATGNSFQILRPTSVTVSSSGSSAGVVTYKRDGLDQEVTEDTVTPSNNRPLPVKLTGVTGDITITANDLDVSLSHADDSVKVGDGTDFLSITAAGEALVSLTTALPSGTNNIGDVDVLSQPARSHSTDSIKVGDGTDFLSITGSGEALVSLTTALPAGTNNIGDVDVLSQPARSHATDSIRIGDGTDLANVTAANQLEVAVTAALPSGTNNIGDVDVLSQPARSHTTDSIRLGDGTDLANVTAANQLEVAVTASLPSGTNNIGDVDVLTQPARSHTTDSIKIGDGADFLSVTASGEALVSLTTALPSGTNNIGDVDVLSQPARSHSTDSMRIGDGTDLVNVTASNQLEVAVTASLPAGSNDIGDVTINNAAGASAVNIQDGGNSITVDGTVAATQSGTWVLGSNSGVDIGDVTINNASGASAVNIQDGGNSITVDGTVAATQSGSWTVTTNTLDIVDLVDANILDTGVTVINGSAGAFVTLVASLAADVKKLQILDTTGGFIGLYTGPAASEVLKLVIGPGSDQTVEATIASGTRLSVRRLDSTTALTSGVLAINFMG